MGNMIIVFGVMILFFQWMHPLQYLRLNLLITKKTYTVIYSIGAAFVFGLIAWMVYLFRNIESIANGPSVDFQIISAVFFIGYIVFNVVTTIYALDKSKEKGKKFYRMLLFVPFAPPLFIIVFLVVMFFYIMLGGAYGFDITSIIGISNNDDMLVIKLLIRLVLISFASIMIYIVIIYIESLTLKLDLKVDSNKIIRNTQIEKRLTKDTLGVVFLVGAMISFFHFAEINTLTYDEQFQIVYQRTLDVFQMIASALFIPLFLNILLDKSKLKKKTENELSKGEKNEF